MFFARSFFAGHLPGADRHDPVAVLDLSLLVHHDHAVRVAVQRDPEVRPRVPHLRRHDLRIEGSALVVDVHPVGGNAEGDHLGAKLREHQRGDPVRRAVGAIHHNAQPFQGEVRGEGALQVYDVTAGRVVDPLRLSDLRRRGTIFLEVLAVHQTLDPGLDVVGELEAVPAEELDPVVGVRVVGGGDDDAGVGSHRTREERDPGGGHRPHEQDVAPHRADPGRQCRFEHVAGQSGVLPDHDLVPAVFPAEQVRRRLPHRQRGLHGHRVGVGDPPHAVGPEQPSHQGDPPISGIGSSRGRLDSR